MMFSENNFSFRQGRMLSENKQKNNRKQHDLPLLAYHLIQKIRSGKQGVWITLSQSGPGCIVNISNYVNFSAPEKNHLNYSKQLHTHYKEIIYLVLMSTTICNHKRHKHRHGVSQLGKLQPFHYRHTV